MNETEFKERSKKKAFKKSASSLKSCFNVLSFDWQIIFAICCRSHLAL